MARGFNKAILMGNLARDPEVRYTTFKQAIAKLTVAVGRQWKGRDGEVQDQTDFIPVVVFGPQAENCERYLSKGRPVLVEGRIQVRSYETSQGEKRWVTEVVAQGVTFLGSRKDRDDYGSGGGPAQPAGNAAPSRGDEGTDSRAGSLRDEWEGDFPMDISEVGGAKSEEEEEADIPF